MNARRLVHQVLALVRGRRLDRELDDEIAAHLEMAEAEGVAAGLSPEQAKRRARLRFGGIDGVVEAHRDRRSVRWLENAVSDLRFGMRMVVREPGFTAVVVGVLALGIGATAAMFSLFDAALIKALPFPNAGRIVRVWEAPREGVVNATTAPDFLDWRRLGTSFEALAAEIDLMGAIRADGDPIRLPGKAVTADYFRVFGIGAERGRTFVAGDDRAGGANVIVLSHAAWETMFGADPDVLKRSLVIDGEPYRVIGVLPAGVFDRGEARFWKPLAFKSEELVRQNHWLTVYGRLAPDATVAAATAQMGAIHSALLEVTPVYKRDWRIVVVPLEKLLVGDGLRRSIVIAFAAAALVLLIACANVANLLLARGATRQKELAVRAALGAGRARLVSQLLTETLIRCVLGAGAGVAVAALLIRLAAPILADSLPFTADVAVDWRVAAFVTAIAGLVAIAVGILPSFQTRFGNLLLTLAQSARGSSGTVGRLRRAIVVGEVALSLVLICVAGLLFRTLFNLQQLPIGVRTDDIVAISIVLPPDLYPSAESASAFYELATQRVGAVPGVLQAAFTSQLPLRWVGNGEGIKLPGIEPMVNVRYKRVDAGYFRAFDIPIAGGRGIAASDRSNTKPVIVINQTLAAQLRETAGYVNPIGRTVGLTTSDYTRAPGRVVDVEIVGVVRNERVGNPWRPDPPVAYVPVAQSPYAVMNLIVRADRNGEGLTRSIREAMRQVAPGLPLGEIETMAHVRAQTYVTASRPAWTLGVFAAVAASLAALGLYGVLAHVVVQRRREIGIRIALGARSRDVMREVLRDGLMLTASGLALGLLTTGIITRLMTSQLYEVSPLDPLSLVVACATMVGIAVAAGLVPASRATRVHPISVLRDDG